MASNTHQYFNTNNEKMAKAIFNAGAHIKMPRESLLSSVQLVDNYERLIDRCHDLLIGVLDAVDVVSSMESELYDDTAHLIEDLRTVMGVDDA